MIVALSRFRVRNGMASEVRAAFVDRPRRVEGVPGFLGMEVLVDRADSAIFWLVTRWTDEETFRAWHRSDEHHASHALIPKGLKLDPSFTLIAAAERISGASSGRDDGDAARDAADLLGPFLQKSAGFLWMHVSPDGVVLKANAGARRLLGEPPVSLWERLVAGSADRLRARLADPAADEILLHVQEGETGVLSLRCDVLRLPDGFVLVGEPSWERHRALEHQLTAVVSDFEVLERASASQARDLARARTELQASLDELERSHWHIKKISEFLPICVSCSKVRADSAGWEPLADYLRRNTLFLSHGYCPTCAEAVLATMRFPRQED